MSIKMSVHRNSFRRSKKPPFQRFKDRCRQFTAFMFSNVGIILLVIFYTIGGAFIFPAIELYYERHKPPRPQRNFTHECLGGLWNVTAANISFYNRIIFKKRVDDILLTYQRAIVNKQLQPQNAEEQWSFSGAFLYSLTVITTIGYGNISPQSDWGKLVTILYAIIGMPLFLLYLSNIGDVLAKSFKWIYSKVCLCRICPGVARRRLIRERRKLKHIVRSRAMQHSSSSSTTSSNGYNGVSEETTSSTQTTNAFDMLEGGDDDSDIERELRGSTDEITVPLIVCVLIMITYILSGAILFGLWENWDTLDGSYFCFISLSSIGFGDLVPGNRVITADKDKVELSFILCAVYLLLGMALIAMCFNLMQEEVVHNVRAIKRGFKACFRCQT